MKIHKNNECLEPTRQVAFTVLALNVFYAFKYCMSKFNKSVTAFAKLVIISNRGDFFCRKHVFDKILQAEKRWYAWQMMRKFPSSKRKKTCRI